jgi:hypothetical protein
LYPAQKYWARVLNISKKRKSKKDGESEKLQDYPKKPMG